MSALRQVVSLVNVVSRWLANSCMIGALRGVFPMAKLWFCKKKFCIKKRGIVWGICPKHGKVFAKRISVGFSIHGGPRIIEFRA